MRLPAVVVHYNDTGAGLMFDVVTGAQRHRLRGWLIDKPLRAPDTETGQVAVA